MKDADPTGATVSDARPDPNDPYFGNRYARIPIDVKIRDARPDERFVEMLPHLTVAGTGSDREDCVEAADGVAKQYYYGRNLIRWVGSATMVHAEYAMNDRDAKVFVYETDVYYMVDPTPTPRVRAV